MNDPAIECYDFSMRFRSVFVALTPEYANKVVCIDTILKDMPKDPFEYLIQRRVIKKRTDINRDTNENDVKSVYQLTEIGQQIYQNLPVLEPSTNDYREALVKQVCKI